MRPVSDPFRSRALMGALAVFAATLLLAACGDDKKSASTTPTAASTATSGTTATTPPTTASVPSGRASSGRPPTSGSSTGTAITVTLGAGQGGAIAFEAKNLAIPAGKVVIKMENASDAGTQHAIAIEGNGVDEHGATVGPGETSTVTAELKAGTYEFYCPVGGHRDHGMKGTLTVT